MPRVSIIMNIRNGASFLQEAIDSVLRQTFTDWELIAWDDCSTDNSAEIVRSYGDARIHCYLSSVDKPLGEARSDAMAAASGDWVAFLDQDDVWLPHKLEQQLALAADRVGLIYGRTVAFDTSGREWDYDHRHEFSSLPEGNIFETLFRDSCFIAMSSAMIRGDVVHSLLPVPSEFRISPDYYLYAFAALNLEARAVQHPVCRYRVHASNMSHWAWGLEQEESLRLLSLVENNLPPALVDRRRKIHCTILGLLSFKNGEPLDGLRTLLRRGSLPYLIGRPAAIAWRTVRRRISRPRWQAQS